MDSCRRPNRRCNATLAWRSARPLATVPMLQRLQRLGALLPPAIWSPLTTKKRKHRAPGHHAARATRQDRSCRLSHFFSARNSEQWNPCLHAQGGRCSASRSEKSFSRELSHALQFWVPGTAAPPQESLSLISTQVFHARLAVVLQTLVQPAGQQSSAAWRPSAMTSPHVARLSLLF